jgi:transposase-like protein
MTSPVKAIANSKDDENTESIAKGSNNYNRQLPKSDFTPALKLEAVNFANRTSFELAAKRFKVDSSSIYKWRKNEDKLKIKML